MTAIDLKRELKVFYNPPATEVVFVDVPPMNFLMIDGAGDPNPSADYQAAIETLYAVSYALKFTLKRAAQGVDYVVMPSESLWWAGDMDRFSMADKADWRWTMMIAQPPGVDETLLAEVLAQTAKKKALPALTRLRFEKLEEGRCAQIMHRGPYEAEAPTIAQLHASRFPYASPPPAPTRSVTPRKITQGTRLRFATQAMAPDSQSAATAEKRARRSGMSAGRISRSAETRTVRQTLMPGQSSSSFQEGLISVA